MFQPTRRQLATALLLSIFSIFFVGRMVASATTSVQLDQCANLGTTCDTSHATQWQNGNLGSSNSHYSEGESVGHHAVRPPCPRLHHVGRADGNHCGRLCRDLVLGTCVDPADPP
ncbi:MAG: hypothetical protein RL430_1668 [Actinomycetota bacterium]